MSIFYTNLNMLFICVIKKIFFKIEILKLLYDVTLLYTTVYIYYLKELLNNLYGHIIYLCVYSSSIREKFRDCWRKPEVLTLVFQLMKGKFESVSSTIFHVMQRICFGFVQKLVKKERKFSVC